jgi:undecaprenyl-diphosphatase
MNIFDDSIISFINGFAHHSPLLDRTVAFVASLPLIKGGVPAAMLWWAWFKNDQQTTENHKHILATLAACVVALAITQVLEHVLPFRPLPTQNPEIVFTLPYGVDIPDKGEWSTFPSDHAVLFFGLVAGFFFVSTAMGWFTFIFCFFYHFSGARFYRPSLPDRCDGRRCFGYGDELGV